LNGAVIVTNTRVPDVHMAAAVFSEDGHVRVITVKRPGA
jgi:hypothetical protein